MKGPLSSLGLTCPVLAAPMAGGATTPALVAAAARAGSLGFLAAGYKTPDLLRQQIAEVRERTPVFAVNLFAPNPVPVDPAEFRRYAAAGGRTRETPWQRHGPGSLPGSKGPREARGWSVRRRYGDDQRP